MSGEPFRHLKAVVLDWAGTTIDHGSLAPTIVFQEIFRRHGVEISVEEARAPMGMAKREHIAAIAKTAEVSARWIVEHERPLKDADIDRMYSDFLPLQKATLTDHCRVITGVAEAVAAFRARGLRIGSSTGYTRELMEVVSPLAAEQGYEPDCVITADDVPAGRPAPWALFEAAKRIDAYPVSSIVKVDDTIVGIEAGKNAGCWTVGITRTGNLVGLSEQAWGQFPEKERLARLQSAEAQFRAAGADYVIESVADLMPVLDEIEARLRTDAT